MFRFNGMIQTMKSKSLKLLLKFWTRMRAARFSFGFKRLPTTNQVSTFLTHTPRKLYSSPPPPDRPPARLMESPASIFEPYTYRFHITASNAKSTTPLRGDQEPPTEDYELTTAGPTIIPAKSNWTLSQILSILYRSLDLLSSNDLMWNERKNPKLWPGFWLTTHV